MSSGVFRGKESSNRIELSWISSGLIEFWCFGLPAALGVGVGGWGWGGGVGGCPPHTCTCMHAHIHVKHDNFNCKWQPPLRESLGIPYDVIHVRVHAHACMCIHVHMCGGHPITMPHPHPPPLPPQGDPQIQSKFNST